MKSVLRQRAQQPTMSGGRRGSAGRWAVWVLAVLPVANLYGQSAACDLDGNGAVNVVDVTRAVNMVLGTLGCSAQVEGPNVCTVVTVQRVVNAALGQPCVTYNAATHSVVLTWLPSPSAGVVGYHIYRRVAGGTLAKITTAPVAGTTYTDRAISSGTTYYYAATSVDASGNESPLSAEATVIVPAL